MVLGSPACPVIDWAKGKQFHYCSVEAVEFQAHRLDDCTHAIYLEVPPGQIVLIKTLLDSYDGVGVTRTADVDDYTVSIFVSDDMLAVCRDVLESMRDVVSWRYAPLPLKKGLDFGDGNAS